MTIMRYTDQELISFIELVNNEIPQIEAFYIVDSFGEMRQNDLERIAYLINHNLKSGVPIGLHSHNNLQLSYSNAVTLLAFPTDRNLIFDVTIMGMGKGAGNLNTELFAEHLNMYYNKSYSIGPLLEIIDSVINQIKQEKPWGYSIEYYLSSRHHCTPSYAGYYYKKHILTIEQMDEILGRIEEEKKISFDQDYAEQLYQLYNEKKYDDSGDLSLFENAIKNKTLLLVAPGKSILSCMNQIQQMMQEKDVVSISLNHFDIFKTDYVFVTKKYIWDEIDKENTKIIVTSNITNCPQNNMNIFDYSRWSKFEGDTCDMAIVLLGNILMNAEISNIVLAGFDGFQVDISQNYYDENLKRPITREQVNERNELMKNFLSYMEKKFKITFLTESLYEKE